MCRLNGKEYPHCGEVGKAPCKGFSAVAAVWALSENAVKQNGARHRNERSKTTTNEESVHKKKLFCLPKGSCRRQPSKTSPFCVVVVCGACLKCVRTYRVCNRLSGRANAYFFAVSKPPSHKRKQKGSTHKNNSGTTFRKTKKKCRQALYLILATNFPHFL